MEDRETRDYSPEEIKDAREIAYKLTLAYTSKYSNGGMFGRNMMDVEELAKKHGWGENEEEIVASITPIVGEEALQNYRETKLAIETRSEVFA